MTRRYLRVRPPRERSSGGAAAERSARVENFKHTRTTQGTQFIIIATTKHDIRSLYVTKPRYPQKPKESVHPMAPAYLHCAYLRHAARADTLQQPQPFFALGALTLRVAVGRVAVCLCEEVSMIRWAVKQSDENHR